MGKSISRIISEFAVNLRFEELPNEVIYEAKRFLYDSIGCAFGAYSTKDVNIIRDIYKEIDSLEKTELEVKTYSQPREEFTLILMIAMLIFVVEQLLGLTILKNTF